METPQEQISDPLHREKSQISKYVANSIASAISKETVESMTPKRAALTIPIDLDDFIEFQVEYMDLLGPEEILTDDYIQEVKENLLRKSHIKEKFLHGSIVIPVILPVTTGGNELSQDDLIMKYEVKYLNLNKDPNDPESMVIGGFGEPSYLHRIIPAELLSEQISVSYKNGNEAEVLAEDKDAIVEKVVEALKRLQQYYRKTDLN
jgi:hypothetical protein